MKKNVMMRAASALGVAVLLSTCVISGTFAKYVTSSTGTSTAHVAKWGFEAPATISIDNLFTYTDSGVKSNDDGKVTGLIAPGTTNSAEFQFIYDTTSNNIDKPEVAYTFTVSTTGSDCPDEIQNNPNIKWYFDGTITPAIVNMADSSKNKPQGSWESLLNQIKQLSGDFSGSCNYAAGTLPASFYSINYDGAKKHTIGWEWAFEKDGTDAQKDAQNVIDTALGNADALASVTLTITITATQIDEYTAPTTP